MFRSTLVISRLLSKLKITGDRETLVKSSKKEKKRNGPTCKGNKTVPEKVATTRTEDGHKQNTKTSTTI
jgi:hypothetical protein